MDLRCPWCQSRLEVDMFWDSPESISCENIKCGAVWATSGKNITPSSMNI